jgi:penicillin-insensitive murein endopeptidase
VRRPPATLLPPRASSAASTWRRPVSERFVLVACLLASGPCLAASQCHGVVGNGTIERAVRLPDRGPNFSAYSVIAAAAGRTYVHSTVAEIVLDAYRGAAISMPDARFVFGETGLAQGGPFKPHKTHQNGLSVDFFVPVTDAEGKPAALPSSPLNHFGYDVELDADGRFGAYRIDFRAMAEHLAQLHLAARARKVKLANVIVDPRYFAQLYATPRGPYLKANLRFMQGKPWVRHDEHFHIDFGLTCS